MNYFATIVFFSISASFCLAEVTESGLDIRHIGKPDDCKRQAAKGDFVTVHYTGKLTNGTIFDSSYKQDKPFEFQLGQGHVIQGWEEGILGMCVEEQRKLIVPAHLGYGKEGHGDLIPPDSDLIFDVELLSIEDSLPTQNVFKEIDKNGDMVVTREEVHEYMDRQMKEMKMHSVDGETAPADIDEDMRNKLVEEIFAEDDKDKDGYISHEEFSGPKHDEL